MVSAAHWAFTDVNAQRVGRSREMESLRAWKLHARARRPSRGDGEEAAKKPGLSAVDEIL